MAIFVVLLMATLVLSGQSYYIDKNYVEHKNSQQLSEEISVQQDCADDGICNLHISSDENFTILEMADNPGKKIDPYIVLGPISGWNGNGKVSQLEHENSENDNKDEMQSEANALAPSKSFADTIRQLTKNTDTVDILLEHTIFAVSDNEIFQLDDEVDYEKREFKLENSEIAAKEGEKASGMPTKWFEIKGKDELQSEANVDVTISTSGHAISEIVELQLERNVDGGHMISEVDEKDVFQHQGVVNHRNGDLEVEISDAAIQEGENPPSVPDMNFAVSNNGSSQSKTNLDGYSKGFGDIISEIIQPQRVYGAKVLLGHKISAVNEKEAFQRKSGVTQGELELEKNEITEGENTSSVPDINSDGENTSSVPDMNSDSGETVGPPNKTNIGGQTEAFEDIDSEGGIILQKVSFDGTGAISGYTTIVISEKGAFQREGEADHGKGGLEREISVINAKEDVKASSVFEVEIITGEKTPAAHQYVHRNKINGTSWADVVYRVSAFLKGNRNKQSDGLMKLLSDLPKFPRLHHMYPRSLAD